MQKLTTWVGQVNKLHLSIGGGQETRDYSTDSSMFLRLNMSLADSRKPSSNQLPFASLLVSIDREKKTHQAQTLSYYFH